MQRNLEMDFPFTRKQHVVYVEVSLALKLCILFVSSSCLITFLPPPSDQGNEWNYFIAKPANLHDVVCTEQRYNYLT